MTNKLFLFDADETLWHSDNHDYISSIDSKLLKINSNIIIRKNDGNKFYLKTDILLLLFKSICESGHKIGIVSDNKKSTVVNALKMFGWWPYIYRKAVNIRLWQGPCPKEVMILEIINKINFKKTNNVYWFDDKDYKSVAKTIGVNFIQINQVKYH